MRTKLICTLVLVIAAAPAAAYERHEILSKDRVSGTITDFQRTHEYTLAVPRDAELSLSLPKVKGSTLQGSMFILDPSYRFVPAFQVGKRKIQTQRPPTASTQYRVAVQGVNESVGDYLLRPKVKIKKRYKIRGNRDQLAPPGAITFGALAGYQVQVTVTWKGPDPVTVASFTDPSGEQMTSEKEAKSKRSSFRQKGFVIEETGDYRVTLDIPPKAKSWTLEVLQKGKPVGSVLDYRDEHSEPPELDLFKIGQINSQAIPFILIRDEVGGGNQFVLTSRHTTPDLLSAIDAGEAPVCSLTPSEPGNTPSGYTLACDDTHTATITVNERDPNTRRIVSYTADPVVAPSGEGTVTFSDMTYNSATGVRLDAWTEVRTFAESGNSHTLVVSEVLRIGTGTFAFTVHHTRPDGSVRRYDFLPF